jgi:iron complex transport system substrate-binding protein
VEHFQIERLDDIVPAIERIGRIACNPPLADQAVRRFDDALEAVRRRVAGLPRPRVLFVIGHERPLAAGPGTFIADLIELAGGVNAGSDVKGHQAWRNTGIEGLLVAAPDVLVCQAEPARQDAARAFYLRLADLPAARGKQVYVVTDPLWSIPGVHLADLAGRLADMIHPRASSTQPGQAGQRPAPSGPAPSRPAAGAGHD